MSWALLAWTAVMFTWMIAGGISASNGNHHQQAADERQLCADATDAGASIGVAGLFAQEEVHRAQPRRLVDQLDAAERVVAQEALWSRSISRPWHSTMYSWAASRNPPGPGAGSPIVMSGPGCMTSTIAWMTARGVKYWPAPDLVPAAFFSSNVSAREGSKRIA